MIDLDEFRERGFVRVDRAVPHELVARVYEYAAELVPANGSPWALGQATVYDFPPLARVISARIRRALDMILGAHAWFLDSNWGFPTRFDGATDVGWHIDGDWFDHHIDSAEQVLTPIFLWHDVRDDDAPTLLVPGSHTRVGKLLVDHEPEGIPGTAILKAVHEVVDGDGAIAAVGSGGDVYLCHPLLAHSINPRGPVCDRRVVSNVCVHGRSRRRLDELPWD